MADQGGSVRGQSPVEVSRGILVAGVALVAFHSALGGALLALALDDPDVVVTERVVETQPAPAVVELADGDVEALAGQLEELVGVEFQHSEGLVHELGAGCNLHDGVPSDDDLTWLRGQLERVDGATVPDRSVLEAFYDDVWAACPT